MDGATPRVLIIEDNELVARSLALMLRKHAPMHAVSLGVLRETIADVPEGSVVLSDLGLEDGGGDEVLQVMETQRPDLLSRFFGMTGGGHMLNRYEATIERSGRPVVLKPIAPAELRSLVENALAGLPHTGAD